MIQQLIELGRGGWYIVVYYGVDKDDMAKVARQLIELDCPKRLIRESILIMSTGFNTGMTFSNSDHKLSFVCIGKTNSTELFVNTVVHEAKHIQSHICDYYGIDERSEKAAYLIGYIVQRMYNMLLKYG